MSVLNFPVKPGGNTAELWGVCMELVQQLESLLFVVIRDVTIETTETPVAHGQNFIPSVGVPLPRTNVAVWQSTPPDERFCYFTAASTAVIDVRVLP